MQPFWMASRSMRSVIATVPCIPLQPPPFETRYCFASSWIQHAVNWCTPGRFASISCDTTIRGKRTEPFWSFWSHQTRRQRIPFFEVDSSIPSSMYTTVEYGVLKVWGNASVFVCSCCNFFMCLRRRWNPLFHTREAYVHSIERMGKEDENINENRLFSDNGNTGATDPSDGRRRERITLWITDTQTPKMRRTTAQSARYVHAICTKSKRTQKEGDTMCTVIDGIPTVLAVVLSMIPVWTHLSSQFLNLHRQFLTLLCVLPFGCLFRFNDLNQV